MDCCSGGFSGNVEVASSPATLVSTPFPWPNERWASKRACWLGEKSTRIFIPDLIRILSELWGGGGVFPPPVTRRRLSVALIYSIPCAALLSPKGFGSEEGACRFVIAHVFSSPHPSSSLISSLALLPSPQKTPSVGSPWRAPPAARVVCPPSWRPSKTQNSFFWWTFPNGNFRENREVF